MIGNPILFWKAVAAIKPQSFLMKNVKGLVVGQRATYFKNLVAEFKNLGYQITWKVLNVADSGVPQKRVRLFVVGMRDRNFIFPEPTHGLNRDLPHTTIQDVLPKQQLGEPNLAKITYAKKPDLRPSPYHGQLFNGGGRPVKLDEPAPTILASAGGNKTHFIDELNLVPEYHAYLMKGSIPKVGTLPGARRLTIDESSLLQTLPKDCTFIGPRTSQYSQVGNAIPPQMGLISGKHIAAQMQESHN